MNIQKLKYPIGEYNPNPHPDEELLQVWIDDIEGFPKKLLEISRNLQAEQLNWRYRPGGWTIKQVIHHCADSHINSVVRFKLALTEEVPAILTYKESLWAELADDVNDDVSYSLQLLSGLHAKWTILLKSLTDAQLNRKLIHPEHDHNLTVKELVGLYSWHCRHHFAHVVNAIQSGGKYC